MSDEQLPKDRFLNRFDVATKLASSLGVIGVVSYAVGWLCALTYFGELKATWVIYHLPEKYFIASALPSLLAGLLATVLWVGAFKAMGLYGYRILRRPQNYIAHYSIISVTLAICVYLERGAFPASAVGFFQSIGYAAFIYLTLLVTAGIGLGIQRIFTSKKLPTITSGKLTLFGIWVLAISGVVYAWQIDNAKRDCVQATTKLPLLKTKYGETGIVLASTDQVFALFVTSNGNVVRIIEVENIDHIYERD